MDQVSTIRCEKIQIQNSKGLMTVETQVDIEKGRGKKAKKDT